VPKCPKCGKEIDELTVKVIDHGSLYLDSDGKPHLDLVSDMYGLNYVETIFSCPECGEELFKAYREAVNFLQKR